MKWMLTLFVALALTGLTTFAQDAPKKEPAADENKDDTSKDTGQEKKDEVEMPEDSLYRLKTKTLDGKDADLSAYKGKVALVVNVASK
ncbi:hypothetical protein PLCT1_01663 [Planctomycetaceae bacterium]|nr:hypothetical protein PLCT1_01663 [Planctomycetaceae bacterium]